MKHLSSIVLAVAVLAAGAVACFKDPTSSLRKGATHIELTISATHLSVGDSTGVQAQVKDAQGNIYDAGDAVWAATNTAVAVVHADTTYIPYHAFSQVNIVGVGAGHGFVTVTSHGMTDTVSVYVP